VDNNLQDTGSKFQIKLNKNLCLETTSSTISNYLWATQRHYPGGWLRSSGQ